MRLGSPGILLLEIGEILLLKYYPAFQDFLLLIRQVRGWPPIANPDTTLCAWGELLSSTFWGARSNVRLHNWMTGLI